MFREQNIADFHKLRCLVLREVLVNELKLKTRAGFIENANFIGNIDDIVIERLIVEKFSLRFQRALKVEIISDSLKDKKGGRARKCEYKCFRWKKAF